MWEEIGNVRDKANRFDAKAHRYGRNRVRVAKEGADLAGGALATIKAALLGEKGWRCARRHSMLRPFSARWNIGRNCDEL